MNLGSRRETSWLPGLSIEGKRGSSKGKGSWRKKGGCRRRKRMRVTLSRRIDMLRMRSDSKK